MVALVAEQTGYPPELLDVDLDLEADLGIDTVKQAELFAQVRETYGIARDDSLKLRDYPTLNHVIGFVRDRTPQTSPKCLSADSSRRNANRHRLNCRSMIPVPAPRAGSCRATAAGVVRADGRPARERLASRRRARHGRGRRRVVGTARRTRRRGADRRHGH